MIFQNAPADPSTFRSAVAYEQELQNAGWVCIGCGAGGRVYRHGTDATVIKVSEDDCYLFFADYAVSNPQPGLPELKTVHTAKGWAVTHIEWLSALDAKNAADIAIWRDGYFEARKKNKAPPPPAEWSKIADDLRQIAIKGNCGFDMKGVNAMQRGETVVFTDPLANMGDG